VLFDDGTSIVVVGAPSVAAGRPLTWAGRCCADAPVHLQYPIRASARWHHRGGRSLWDWWRHHYSAYWPDAHARLAAHVLSRFLASEVALQQTSAYAEARERANQLHRPLLIALIEGEQGYAGLPPLVRTLVPCDGVAVTCGDGVFGDGVIPPADRVRDRPMAR
jgi:hypothetical protein